MLSFLEGRGDLFAVFGVPVCFWRSTSVFTINKVNYLYHHQLDKIVESYANQLNVESAMLDVVALCQSQVQGVSCIQVQNLETRQFHIGVGIWATLSWKHL